MLSPDSTPGVVGPDWKLDRRGSGRLFWRRDSSCAADAASRVKFRYDVEVLEFWEAEDAAPAPAAASNNTAAPEDKEPERRDALRARKTPEQAPPFLLCVACVAAIALMICYQWMLSG